MTLAHAMGHLDAESEYTVRLSERLRDLLFEGDEVLGSDVSFSYEWHGGYEHIEYHRANGGGLTYSGSYHPNIVCETGTSRLTGICRRCGVTLM